MILLALVDQFRYLKIGSPGGCHDGGVYGASNLCETVKSEDFSFPVPLINSTKVQPVIWCDQVFPVGAHLQKACAHAASGSIQAICNYNLPKTRRFVKNAFGQLKERMVPFYYEANGLLPGTCQKLYQSCMHSAQCVRVPGVQCGAAVGKRGMCSGCSVCTTHSHHIGTQSHGALSTGGPCEILLEAGQAHCLSPHLFWSPKDN